MLTSPTVAICVLEVAYIMTRKFLTLLKVLIELESGSDIRIRREGAGVRTKSLSSAVGLVGPSSGSALTISTALLN